MIRIITARTLAALRAEAALVPGLRRAAEEAEQARDEAAAAAARAAVQQVPAARDAALADTRPELALLAARTQAAAEGPARPAGMPRREIVGGHLARILAVPAPAIHLDYLTGPDRDHGAASRQVDQVRILQLLFGCDEVAAAYSQWLDGALSEQAKTAGRLRSWDEVALDSTPIGWGNRDVHGFLCARCGDSSWQVILAAGFPDRLCVRCARELDLEPGQVWAPRLPPAHGHLEYPGRLPAEAHESSITVRLGDDTTRRYELGDATAFLVHSDWGDRMGMTAAGTVSGEADRPRMEISGSTRREGHRLAFAVILDFDPAPQGTRQAPYGFRYTAGTLTSHGQACAITGVFDLLDTIARGEEALTSAPAVA
jgi:hypothetical protein